MNNTRIWTLAAFLTLSLAFGSLFDSSQAGPIIILGCQNNSDCGCSTKEQADLNCSAGSGAGGSCLLNGSFGKCQCNPGFGDPSCGSRTGACCGGLSPCASAPGSAAGCAAVDCREVTQFDCTLGNGTYAGDGTNCSSGICDPATPTATPTATATVTPTQTPVAQGGDCTDASQCAPGLFCSDAVCCDTACTGSGQSCDTGTCVTAPAQAPTASGYTLAAMLGLLVLTGLLGIRAARR